jgi:hypothetical protein
VQQKNILATVSFILSILGLLTGFTSVIGVILGIIAYRYSKKIGGKGKNISIAAIVIGCILTVLYAAMAVLAIVLLSKNQ